MIRRLFCVAAACIAAFAAGCAQTRTTGKDSAEETEAASPRRFRFRYEAHIPAPKSDVRRLDVWIPLPLQDPGVQEIDDVEVTVSDGLGYEVTQGPRYGNRMIHVGIDDPRSALDISWSALVTRYEDRGQGRLPINPRFLKDNMLIPIGASARSLAGRLHLDDASLSTRSKAHRIYDDVLGAMAYDKSAPGWGRGDFERAVTVCRGNCTDFHSRFIGVARAAGIPCRFTMGIPIKETPEGSYDSYHCWAHWNDHGRWLPVDISEADKIAAKDPAAAQRFFGNLDANRISMTTGRDIVLSPRQAGDPLNYFVFPYVEADGRTVPLKKGMWRFSWRDV